MQQFVLYVHVVVGVLFIIFVLMQDRGVGFGGAIGGTGGGGFYATKRGAAKIVHRMTVVLCFLFLASALIYVVLPADPVAVDVPPPADLPAVTTSNDVPVSMESLPLGEEE